MVGNLLKDLQLIIPLSQKSSSKETSPRYYLKVQEDSIFFFRNTKHRNNFVDYKVGVDKKELWNKNAITDLKNKICNRHGVVE